MNSLNKVEAGGVPIGEGAPLLLIAGPCVIESEAAARETAAALAEITGRLSMPWIFKASYDKANRTSIDSFRGPGAEKGLGILARIKEDFRVPVICDAHSPDEAKRAGKVLDVIQIPAFLCRQTDLIVAAAKTGKAVNIKKGQFLSPYGMLHAIKKAEAGGAKNIMITERGSTFGYNNLVVDMRSFRIIRDFGYPVIFDATHSVQLPGGAGNSSGGEREHVAALARAAVAAGVDGVFMEVHPDPDNALCDGPNSIKLDALGPLLETLIKIDRLVEGKT